MRSAINDAAAMIVACGLAAGALGKIEPSAM
jgi:hypothetical protein